MKEYENPHDWARTVRYGLGCLTAILIIWILATH